MAPSLAVEAHRQRPDLLGEGHAHFVQAVGAGEFQHLVGHFVVFGHSLALGFQHAFVFGVGDERLVIPKGLVDLGPRFEDGFFGLFLLFGIKGQGMAEKLNPLASEIHGGIVEQGNARHHIHVGVVGRIEDPVHLLVIDAGECQQACDGSPDEEHQALGDCHGRFLGVTSCGFNPLTRQFRLRRVRGGLRQGVMCEQKRQVPRKL